MVQRGEAPGGNGTETELGTLQTDFTLPTSKPGENRAYVAGTLALFSLHIIHFPSPF